MMTYDCSRQSPYEGMNNNTISWEQVWIEPLCIWYSFGESESQKVLVYRCNSINESEKSELFS